MIQSKTITKWKGAVQMASRVNDIETGFADIHLMKGEVYTDLCTSHYYIIMIMSGEVTISCKLYQNRLIKAGTMAFIPRSGKMRIVLTVTQIFYCLDLLRLLFVPTRIYLNIFVQMQVKRIIHSIHCLYARL